MKMDQVAYFSDNQFRSNDIKKDLEKLGCKKWVVDNVTSINQVFLHGTDGQHNLIGEAEALLQFNYELDIELEVLEYLSGPHWHMLDHRYLDGMLLKQSHIGIHLEADEPFPEHLSWKLVQSTRTIRHTNSYVVERKRTYEYRIFEVSNDTYVKFIRRIQEGLL